MKQVETVVESQAVLVANKELVVEKQAILDRLIFRIEAVKQSSENKYILLNAPNYKLDEIIALLPGMKSPTILPLAQDGWSSIHTVIKEDTFWDIIEQLKTAGAEGILVLEIEKMIL